MTASDNESEPNGTAAYVEAGFMVDVFEPWMYALSNDNWGVYVAALWNLARAALSQTYYDKAKAAMLELLAEMECAFGQGGWMSESDPGVPTLRRKFPESRQYWRARADYFGVREAYDAVMARLPEWVKPPPRRRQPKG